MKYEIYYGIEENKINITEICLKKSFNDNILIPSTDVNRSKIFGDPIVGTVKYIFIVDENETTTKYDDTQCILINLQTNTIETNKLANNALDCLDPEKRLEIIQSKLTLTNGKYTKYFPEQLMVCKYLTGNEKVLEFGGNIGRNSLVIASILNSQNNTNLVVLEPNKNLVEILIHNKQINNLNFHIEPSALSTKKLIQQGLVTKQSEIIEQGWIPVDIISYKNLINKYNITFDTLVIDCEGAFYYILKDIPQLLNNIKLIIMENEYWNVNHKKYIDDILSKNNFVRDHVEKGHWGMCQDYFYETWKK